jgi:hypothetical protein
MRASQDDLRAPRRWGDLGVASAETLAARCAGACDGHHWGYVIAGVMRVAYPDHEEIIGAGDAYYVAPGHVQIELDDAKLVDFGRPAG